MEHDSHMNERDTSLKTEPRRRHTLHNFNVNEMTLNQ